MAYAGTAALAEDATSGYYNVAGLTRIKQGSVVGTVTGFLLTLDFHPTSSTVYGQPVSGSTGVDPTRNVLVPSFHAAWRLDERWVLGFGVTAPYGLELKYPSDSVVRYVATKSELLTYNFNPMIAYRINDQCDDCSAGIEAATVVTVGSTAGGRLVPLAEECHRRCRCVKPPLPVLFAGWQ